MIRLTVPLVAISAFAMYLLFTLAGCPAKQESAAPDAPAPAAQVEAVPAPAAPAPVEAAPAPAAPMDGGAPPAP